MFGSENQLPGNIHTDYYECLDEWIHIGNLSNWFDTPDKAEKDLHFEIMLNKALREGKAGM